MANHILLIDDYPDYKGIVVNYNLREVHREYSSDIVKDAIKMGAYLKSVGIWEWLYSSSVDDYGMDNDINLRELIESVFI